MADKTFQIEITKDTTNAKDNCITFDDSELILLRVW